MTLTVPEYLLNIGIALDQLVNTVFKGYPDETLSSRTYRNACTYWYARWTMKLLDFIFLPFGKAHCRRAYESEIQRKHLFPTGNEPAGEKLR